MGIIGEKLINLATVGQKVKNLKKIEKNLISLA
jgi:hypothetical protein